MTFFKSSLFAAAALAVFSPLAAEAASRSLNFTPHDLEIQGTASYAAGAVELPDTGSASVVANFVLPRDYKADTAVRFRLVIFTNSACSAKFELLAASRVRGGALLYNSLQEMSFANGSFATSTGAHVGFSKTLVIHPAAAFGGQKPGDGILVTVKRDSTSIADTCEVLYIRHGEVRYTVK